MVTIYRLPSLRRIGDNKMGGRQSSVGSEDRPRSNSMDATAAVSEQRPPARNASRSVISSADFIQTLRAARLMGSSSDSDDEPGTSRGTGPGGRHRLDLPLRHNSHVGSSSGTVGSHHHRSNRHHRQLGRRSMPFFVVEDITCPVCKKTVPSDDADVHLVMCLTRPKITYNDDVLTEDKGECSICLDDMQTGETIARLPCLCIYHKSCIDDWFKRKNCCPEHPGDD